MAIQVNGTTVIDNSRALTNISTVDAATAAAIGNAGVGGGGEQTFTAASAISAGDAVGIDSQGKIATIGPLVSESNLDFTTSNDWYGEVYLSSSYYSKTWHVYGHNGDRFVTILAPTGGVGHDYIYAMGGVIAANGTITYSASKYTIGYRGANAPNSFGICNIKGTNKFVCHFGTDTNWPGTSNVVCFEVNSDATITVGSPVATTYDRYDWQRDDTIASFSNGNFIVCYSKYNGGSYASGFRIGSISGTSISLGSEYVMYSTTSDCPLVDVNNDNRFAVGTTTSSGTTRIAVGTISGTTASYTDNTYNGYADANGGGVAWASNDWLMIGSGYYMFNRTSGNTVVYTNNSNSRPTGGTANYVTHLNSTYDGKVYVFSSVSGKGPCLISGSLVVTGGTANISWNEAIPVTGSFTVYGEYTKFSGGKLSMSNAYVVGGNYPVVLWLGVNIADFVTNSYVGLAKSNISANATGTVVVAGGIITGLSGYTAGVPYTLNQLDGQLITSPTFSDAIAIGLSSSSLYVK